jgi:hypothetical protein
VTARCVAQARGLPAREDDRFHYRVTRSLGSATSGSASKGELCRPTPS